MSSFYETLGQLLQERQAPTRSRSAGDPALEAVIGKPRAASKPAGPSVLDTASNAAGAAAATVATHKAGESALSLLARQMPGTRKLLENYYANVAQAGLDAGLAGEGHDLLPHYRRAIGGIFPTLSGLADYETARAMGVSAREKALRYGFDPHTHDFRRDVMHSLLTDDRPDVVESVRDVNSEVTKWRSPVLRNIMRGAYKDSYDNPVVAWLRKGRGTDSQRYGGRIVGAAHSAMGALAHGPAGAIGAGTLGMFDGAAVGAANRGRANTILGLKGRVIRSGMRDGSGTMGLLRYLDPSTYELHAVGRDVSSIRDPESRAEAMVTLNKLTHHADIPIWEALQKDVPQLRNVAKWLRRRR